MRLPALFATAFALLAAPAHARDLTPAEKAKIDTIVAEAMAFTGVPSASIAVVVDGKLVLAKAYGKQGPDVPVTTTAARYQIASVSKQFTAAAILLLQDEGKLSLDDKVAKWLPGITGGDRISIRQLLSHTSGLQDYWPQDYSFIAMEKPTTPQGIVDRWAKKPLDFEPDAQWQYSNTGYVVAGMIVEKASGETLLGYLNRKIFRPLGMDPIDQDLAAGPGFPSGYHRYALGPVHIEKQPGQGWLWAAGELSMTPIDLAKWDIARIDRAVLPKADWETQETPVFLTSGKNSNYGLGVSIADNDGVKTISHDGEAVGFLTDNMVIPAKRFAVVAAVNADFGNAQDMIANKVRDLLLPAAPSGVEADRLALAKRVYAGLQAGRIDRGLFTENGNYYFTAEALKDFHASLAPLGTPLKFEAHPPRLRGGFVNRNYVVTYAKRKLEIVTYADPGKDGKIEQFMVMPVE